MVEKARPYALGVVGSPRHGGNSDLLCSQVLEGARHAGADVETVYLHDARIEPCRACEVCLHKGDGTCVIDDGMGSLYPKLRRCDVLVIASPIYFLNLSAQTVAFINRLYPLFNPSGCRIGATQAVACLAYGDRDPIGSGCDIAARILRDLFSFTDIELKTVHASALKRGDVAANEQVMAQAVTLGERAVAAVLAAR